MTKTWEETVMNQKQMADAIIESNELPMGQALIEHQAEATWLAREPEIEELKRRITQLERHLRF